MHSVELKTVVSVMPRKPVQESVQEKVSKSDIRTSLKASTMDGIFVAMFVMLT